MKIELKEIDRDSLKVGDVLEASKNMKAIIQGVAMFEELYKFISRLHYGIKFMPEKDFDELLSRCDWEQKMYALCFRYW